jgi:hypothetical protein
VHWAEFALGTCARARGGSAQRRVLDGTLPGEPAAARHRRTGDDGTAAHRRGDGGATATGDVAGCGPSDVAWTAAVGTAAVRARQAQRGARSGRELSERDVRARRRCRAGERRGRGSCRDTWRAVPTAALSHGVGAARGGHAAAARAHSSAISELKFIPKEISSK